MPELHSRLGKIRRKARRWVYFRWSILCLSGIGLILYGGNRLPSPPPQQVDSSTSAQQIQENNVKLQVHSNEFIYLMVGVLVMVIALLRIARYAYMNNLEDYYIEELIERRRRIQTSRQRILSSPALVHPAPPILTVQPSDPMPSEAVPVQESVEYRETKVPSIPYIAIPVENIPYKPKFYDWYKYKTEII